jgi:hypothetical protein
VIAFRIALPHVANGYLNVANVAWFPNTSNQAIFDKKTHKIAILQFDSNLENSTKKWPRIRRLKKY